MSSAYKLAEKLAYEYMDNPQIEGFALDENGIVIHLVKHSGKEEVLKFFQEKYPGYTFTGRVTGRTYLQ